MFGWLRRRWERFQGFPAEKPHGTGPPGGDWVYVPEPDDLEHEHEQAELIRSFVELDPVYDEYWGPSDRRSP